MDIRAAEISEILKQQIALIAPRLLQSEARAPGYVQVIATAINIMQERITRINLAVDPPDILVQPRLGSLKMMDFDQVDRAIEEGYIGVMERIDDIKAMLQQT